LPRTAVHLEGIRAQYVRESSSERIAAEYSFVRDEENPKIHFDKRVTRIEAYGVVAEASDWVRAARERLEQERQGSELDR
jgi:hypothetical protein